MLAAGHSFAVRHSRPHPSQASSSTSINRGSLRRSLAGISPKINRSLLRIAINLIQLCIRELKFLNRIKRVVELLHIASSDKRRGDPPVT